MSIKLDPSSNRVFKKVKNLRTNIESEVRNSLYEIGKELKQTASRDTLKKPKHGRTYFRTDRAGRKRRHVSSAPGESWANRSGTARKAIKFSVRGSKNLRFTNDVPYVAYLEDKSKLNRPAMFNAIQKNKGLNINLIRSNVGRAF